jgi:AcrR family transcriptional regulator
VDPEKVLEVARGVFLARGIRATTQEVAEKAGVSEGIIFHRFKTKEALFRAAMRLNADDAPRLFGEMVQSIEGLELKEALFRLANGMLEVGRVALPLMMMTWSNPELCTSGHFDGKKPAYRVFFTRLVAYFEGQVQAGVLRRMDAEVFARTFIGAIHHYAMMKILVEDDEALMLPEGMFVRGLVDLLLNGASPAPVSVIPTSTFGRPTFS